MALPNMDNSIDDRIDTTGYKGSRNAVVLTLSSMDDALYSILETLREQLALTKDMLNIDRDQDQEGALAQIRERVEKQRELEVKRESDRIIKSDRIEQRERKHGFGNAGNTALNILDSFGRRTLSSASLVTALGLAAVIANWDKVSTFFNVVSEQVAMLWPKVKAVGEVVIPFVSENFTSIITALFGIFASAKIIQMLLWIGKIKAALTTFGINIAAVAGTFAVIASGVMATLKSIEAFNAAGGGLDGLIASIDTFIATFLGTVPNLIIDLAEWIARKLSFDQFADSLSQIDMTEFLMLDNITQFFEDIFSLIGDKLAQGLENIKEFIFGKRTDQEVSNAETPSQRRQVQVRRLAEEIQMLQEDFDNTSNAATKARLQRRIMQKQNEQAQVIQEHNAYIAEVQAANDSLPDFEKFAQGVPARDRTIERFVPTASTNASGGIAGLNVNNKSEVINRVNSNVNVIAPATQITDARSSTSVSNQSFIGPTPVRTRRSMQQRDFVFDR